MRSLRQLCNERMVTVTTTAFEDLILGSQFLPVIENKITNSSGLALSHTQGLLQCRHCKASFEEEQEALIHYKLHIFEIHKSHFSIVVGDLCPRSNCIFAGTGCDVIHFHCAHCPFASREILELPLHMEEVHLPVYEEINLCLKDKVNQLNRAYKCGECDSTVQGSISTVLHFLSHDAPKQLTMEDTTVTETVHNHTNVCSDVVTESADESRINDTADIDEDKMEVDPVENGRLIIDETNFIDGAEDAIDTKDDTVYNGDASDHTELSDNCDDLSQKILMTNPQLANLQGRVLLPLLLNSMKNKDKGSCELNPLMLLASLMEADQKSDCPLIPTQHFLLDENHHKEEDQEYLSPPSPADGGGGDPSPESILNGFRDPYKSTAASFVEQPPGVFQCDQCPEAFKYQYQLTAHRKESSHSTKPKSSMSFPFRCHICGNEFTALADLKNHVWIHSSDYDTFCEICGHAFTDDVQLQEHASKHSSGSGDNLQAPNSQNSERSNRCECCSTKFTSKPELTLHIVKYQGTCNPNRNSEGVKCATCSFVVADLEALKKHRIAEHPSVRGTAGKRGFDCDYCGKTFSCRSNLRDHLVVHTGEKPYPCDICGKAFSFVHNMKTHRLTHNEGRNEMCPYCDRAYKSKISLYYHMKKGNCRGLSTKEVPEGFHRCSECLQMFASEERYIQHKKKDLCQLSFRCEHCGVRCSNRMKLNRHIEKGVCTKLPEEVVVAPKKHMRGTRRIARNSKARSRRSDDNSGSGTLCERCNYGRDCCCTFSCKYCGKRIFSFDAYNAHRRRHCPAKKAKERLRAALKERVLNEATAPEAALTTTAIVDGVDPKKCVIGLATPEEDSNSGSLADLTTFTASHLLGSVSSVQET